MIPCKQKAIRIPNCGTDGAVCDLKDKELTENGVYYPTDDNADGYGVVTVNVEAPVIPDASGNDF